MKYPVKSGGVDFEPVPAGTHIAVCDIVADIGMQPGSQAFPKAKRQVYIRFELPSERKEFEKDGKKQEGPAVIGKTYTASMNEKATLRAHLESWRGRAFTDEEAADFEVSSILGKPCVLNVTHTSKDGKNYANITGIGKLMKGVDPKNIIPELPPVHYGPDNEGTYQQLPEWLRKKIDGQIIEEEKPATQQSGNQISDGSFITDSDLPPEMGDSYDDGSIPF